MPWIASRAPALVANGSVSACGCRRMRAYLIVAPEESSGSSGPVHPARSSAGSTGGLRRCLPVAAKIAFIIAGTTADAPGSPRPPGCSVFWMMCTSISGASLIRRTRYASKLVCAYLTRFVSKYLWAIVSNFSDAYVSNEGAGGFGQSWSHERLCSRRRGAQLHRRWQTAWVVVIGDRQDRRSA